ncbi:MAG: hypothetical protein ACOVKN_02830, partial [Arenimonas sp.]
QALVPTSMGLAMGSEDFSKPPIMGNDASKAMQARTRAFGEIGMHYLGKWTWRSSRRTKDTCRQCSKTSGVGVVKSAPDPSVAAQQQP